MSVRSTSPSPNESRAAAAVAAVLGVERGRTLSVQHWDTPGHQGRHDFWLHDADDRIALEVTTLAEEADITNRMHWRTRGPSYDLTVPGLTAGWIVTIDPGRSIARPLMKGIAGWLTSLENDGITSTGQWDGSRPHTHPVVGRMVRSGVVQAERVATLPAGTVAFSYYTYGRPRPAHDPDHITVALSEALKLTRHQKNAAKLARAYVHERHLFLWVDWTRLDVSRALDAGVPATAPVVNGGITTVWLGFPAGNEVELLRWSPADGWQRHVVDG